MYLLSRVPPLTKPLVIKGRNGLILHCKLMDTILSWSLNDSIVSWVATYILSDQNYKGDNGMSVEKLVTLVPNSNETGLYHLNLKCRQDWSLLDQHEAHLHQMIVPSELQPHSCVQ